MVKSVTIILPKFLLKYNFNDRPHKCHNKKLTIY